MKVAIAVAALLQLGVPMILSPCDAQNVVQRSSEQRARKLEECFLDREELLDAVDDYVALGQGSAAFAVYGPIEDWCVSSVSDFESLFSANRNAHPLFCMIQRTSAKLHGS